MKNISACRPNRPNRKHTYSHQSSPIAPSQKLRNAWIKRNERLQNNFYAEAVPKTKIVLRLEILLIFWYMPYSIPIRVWMGRTGWSWMDGWYGGLVGEGQEADGGGDGSLSGGSMPRTAIIADKNTLAEMKRRRKSARYYPPPSQPPHHSMVLTCTVRRKRVYGFVWTVGRSVRSVGRVCGVSGSGTSA